MTSTPPKVELKNKLNYRSLLGEVAWQRLHPAIQKRFCEENYKKSVVYVGTMQEVKLSTVGKLFAQLCRLIGTPLALYSGENIPTTVFVYPNDELNGVTWDRHYNYPDRPQNRIKSTKCLNNKLGLIEVVGYGFCMQLKLYEHGGDLYFERTNFYFQAGKYQIRIPPLLTPGKTFVIQKALDESKFQFSLDVNHLLFGNLFRQIGIFADRDCQSGLLRTQKN